MNDPSDEELPPFELFMLFTDDEANSDLLLISKLAFFSAVWMLDVDSFDSSISSWLLLASFCG